jgi:predicted phage terminase large subunit-like protein
MHLPEEFIEEYPQFLARDFPSFIGRAFHTVNPGIDYLPNWHIELIADRLESVRRGDITRLIINMPPRSLKSLCVSIAWPAWLLGHDPASRIMAASYASSLAVRHSIDCRQVVRSPWYRKIFPATRLARDQNEKHKFMTTRRGYRFAVSVGGSMTGEGGNFLIIDDPISPMQAMSSHWRDYVNHWFDHTFSSRLDDKRKGAIVLVMQRLHTQDLSEYLMGKGGWMQLVLPAVAASTEVYDFAGACKRREAGELLHELREGREHVERAKIELGSAAFAAQYQQNPVAEEGVMVRPWWFSRYAALPGEFERCVQSWDTGIKSGSGHDASACLTFLESSGRSYLAHVYIERMEYPDLKRTCLRLAEHYRPDAVLIEDKGSGQQLLQDLRRETSLPVIGCLPKGDKIVRFAAVSAMLEAEKLVLPQEATWLAEFQNEVFSFPSGAHDDQVDALSQYLNFLKKSALERVRIRSR